jgi:hypothetical protein
MAVSWPDPIEIFEHYLKTREALAALKSNLLRGLLAGPGGIAVASRFLNRTAAEIDDEIGKMEAELDIQINLLLIASGEASLRVDFQARIKARKKEPITKRFRNLERQRIQRRNKGVRLEDILEIWKSTSTLTSSRQSVASMGRLFLYRHWIAHGRYWVEDKSGLNSPDPYEV